MIQPPRYQILPSDMSDENFSILQMILREEMKRQHGLLEVDLHDIDEIEPIITRLTPGH